MIHVLLTALAFVVNPVLACECQTPTVCQAYSLAKFVYVGKLVSVERTDKARREIAVARFQVERTYKGNVAKMEVAEFGTCDELTLTPGERYLVYVVSSGGTDNICNRSGTLKQSASDLEYLNSLSSSAPTFIVGGRIDGLSAVELAKAKLIVEIDQTERVVSIDEHGFFSFVTREASEFRVKLTLPFSAEIRTNNLGRIVSTTGNVLEYRVQIAPNECDYRTIEIVKK